MFDALTEKLTSILGRLAGKGRLTEADIDQALQEVRRALLEADVHFQVVRDLLARVKEQALGAKVLESIAPGQQVVKIVHEELTRVLGGEARRLDAKGRSPAALMLVGLQGSGKTTTAAKLALLLKKQGAKVLLAAADLRRPAAVQQLVILGKQLDIPVYAEPATSSAPAVARNALAEARRQEANWLVVDTGGRLHIDAELMEELAHVREALDPAETLLVVDAMTGQDAVRAAEEFHRQVPLTGLILAKMDGDARGGAALSITAVTGLPILYLGVGEKAEGLEPYFPDRLAGRILGMGDVVSLVEKAQQVVDQKKALEMQKKLQSATFNLEDMLEQLRQLQKMGPLSQILEMVPGFSALQKRLPAGAVDEGEMKRVEAIILSMTLEERRRPDIIGGSRRKRIARGSGATPADVNRLLNQFFEMQKLMKRLSSGKARGPGLPSLFR